eukprot:scaffold257331_cov27-Tisochrysis_lutea.AAC.4
MWMWGGKLCLWPRWRDGKHCVAPRRITDNRNMVKIFNPFRGTRIQLFARMELRTTPKAGTSTGAPTL